MDERVVLDNDGQGGWEALAAEDVGKMPDVAGRPSGALLEGLTGEGVRIVKEPDLEAVRKSLKDVLDRGITSLAVVFLHRCACCGVQRPVRGCEVLCRSWHEIEDEHSHVLEKVSPIDLTL